MTVKTNEIDRSASKKFTMALRSKNYEKNWLMISQKSCYKKLIQNLHARKQRPQSCTISYRQLNHWDNEKLLECERKSKGRWRLFNTMESIWLQVVKQLREFGMSFEKISICKAFFFENLTQSSSLTHLECHLLDAVLFHTPVFFIILPDASAALLSHDQIQQAYSTGSLSTHISIHLNPLINELHPLLKVSSRFETSPVLSKEEMEIATRLRFGGFDKLTIETSSRKLKNYKILKHYSSKIKFNKLMKKVGTGSLKINMQDDAVSSFSIEKTHPF